MIDRVDSPIVVGCFGKTFGVLGWLKIVSFTSPKDNILDFKKWLVQKDSKWEKICYEDYRKHSGSIIVKIPGYDSPEDSSVFTNSKIAVLYKQLPKLPKNEYYWADLMGLNVVNKGNVSFGVVKDIMPTGANDVLVVVDKKSKYLIPYISTVIVDIDVINKKMVVDWERDFL